MVGASAAHDRCRAPFPFACAAFVLMTQNGIHVRDTSRQIWGVISDRIRLAGRIDDGISAEAGLFTVAAGFELGFSGIIPAYVLAVRELFPASEASCRIPILLLFSGGGMAAGGWIAGLLYDHLGYYAPAFALGIGTIIANLLLITVLVGRHRCRAIYA
jgi:hypothetical protein